MSQHDYDITTADANTGSTFRAAVNAALQALASNNSGATAPSVTYPNLIWPDTGNILLKMRNTANTAWITIGTLDAANLGLAVAANVLALSGGTMTGPLDWNESGDEYIRVPRLTSTQRNALSGTAGMFIYNTTEGEFHVYTTDWKELADTNTAQTFTNKTLTTPTIGDLTNAGHGHTNAASGGKLAASGMSAILGTWDTSKVKDTNYQAATDLIVIVICDPGGSAGNAASASCLTDSSTPPTVERAKANADGNPVGSTVSVTFVVKKDDYWKVVSTITGAGTVTINAIPIGS